ncbi:PATTERN FORMATION PROTEIN GNOM PROTEIN [Salix purpurea]|uniref:PATTERN FORMATION PROTEIN GNOM PROTEIN n=1 Tax=Salix purpurea TaxID=77065 RepID=A0A9Q1ACR8_SALPP|nr:PATTERN FORMATION PROTEIN GNOM PROTEIN [Salix purpurea]
MENGNGNSELDGQASSASYSSNASTALVATEESAIGAGGGKLAFHLIASRDRAIWSAMHGGDISFPDELFHNMMQLGFSMSPLNGLSDSSESRQEVAMEVLVDFCRQKTFVVEMHANLVCDVRCSNVFADLANLLSKSAFPVNCPLCAMHILAVDGLIAAIQGMAERICNGSYIVGLDKNLVGDFLGNHDDFCVQILHELAWTFDIQDMNVDTALRLFLETARLPGESHKLQRALEAFSER